MRTLLLALVWLVISMPSIAAGACLEIPTGPLASEEKEKARKPINEVVEALLHDAETIYTEGVHIVERKPRTDVESLANDRMEDLHDFGESYGFKECHLQQTYTAVIIDYDDDNGDAIDRMLIRIWDFDVAEAKSCANTAAAVDLKLARQSLDHGWMEFNGKEDEKDWKPDESIRPSIHESCINVLLTQPREQWDKLVQDQIERYRKAASSLLQPRISCGGAGGCAWQSQHR